MRTPFYPYLRALLREINDMYILYVVATQGIENDTKRFSPQMATSFIPDVLHHIPAAKALHFQLSEYPSLIARGYNFTGRAYFVFILAALETYLNELADLCADTLGTTPKGDTPLLKLSNALRLGTSHPTALPDHAETLDYLRLRRNALVHRSGKASPLLRDLVATRAPALATYWSTTRPAIVFDFRDEHLEMFSYDEVIAILRLVRVVVAEMDNQIATNHGPDLVRYRFRALTHDIRPNFYGDAERDAVRRQLAIEFSTQKAEIERYV